jgi:hypothetical protein
MDHYLKTRTDLFEKLYTKVENESEFEALALEIFHFQYRYNNIYRRFVDLIKVQPNKVTSLLSIPFLPIQLFKTHEVKSGRWEAEKQFRSSGTSFQSPSIHQVRRIEHYNQNAVFCFESIFGKLKDFRWYGLLPNYLEQGNSSLVHMVNHFMSFHPRAKGGFFMHDYPQLIEKIGEKESGLRTVLIGVSYALLDMAIQHAPDLGDAIVIETGGMKGRGKELPRSELHEILKEKFKVDQIYSEYGMTELLSQAYSMGDGIFTLAPTMKLIISELNDFKNVLPAGEQGRLQIIDLANIDTCSFIATDDLGSMLDNRRFTISGRADHSELRGCNLLYTS